MTKGTKKTKKTKRMGTKRMGTKRMGTKKMGTKKMGTKKIDGKWSMKYKKSINCSHPKGFSQKQHCKYGRKLIVI
jgi:hypothetical protein